MRRLFSIILVSALLIAFCFPFGADAKEGHTAVYNEDYIYADVAEYISECACDLSLYEYDAETDSSTISIDIKSFSVQSTQASVFLNSLLRQRTELFFIAGSMSYSVSSSGIISVVCFTSLYDIEAVPDMIKQVNQKVDAVIAEAGMLPTDEDKALYVHNYIASNTRYTEAILTNTPTDRDSIYTIYGVLGEGDAVCQGYALTFNHIMRRMGVVCDFVMSTSMNHGWSLIRLNNKWYHVDVTWDDIQYDICGRFYYNNFLRSAEGIIEAEHSEYDPITTINSTTTDYIIGTEYEELCLHNKNVYKGNFVWVNGRWYFTKVRSNIVEGYDICATDNIFAKEEDLSYDSILNVSSIWFASATSCWQPAPGLQLFEDKLLYVTADEIRSCSFDGTNSTTVYTPEKEEFYNIYGIMMNGNTIYYELLNSPNKEENGEFLSFVIPETEIHFTDSTVYEENGYILGISVGTTVETIKSCSDMNMVIKDKHGLTLPNGSLICTGDTIQVNTSASCNTSYTIIVLGDTNSDGRANSKDIIQIKKYLSGDTLKYELAADFNNDGVIDLEDLTAISASATK